jgi:capsular polysaccharide biosynthesis protein
MSPAQATAPADLEGEQEVDLASAWQRVKVRWWLPVVGLAAGALVGLVLALSGGDVWRAETIVYLGQPFAPLGGGQIQSLATNPRTVSEIVRSESAIKAASDESGVPPGKLRSSISTKELTAVGQARGINPLIEIAVKASGPRKAEQAANAFAERVVENVSVYVTEKVELLKQQIAQSEAQLAAVTARINQAQEQQDAVLANRSLPAVERLLLSANLNSVITTADARRSALQEDVFEARQLLNLSESVETSRVVEPARAVKTTARSSRTSLLVGALIGLLAGLVGAIAAEPIAARRERTATRAG